MRDTDAIEDRDRIRRGEGDGERVRGRQGDLSAVALGGTGKPKRDDRGESGARGITNALFKVARRDGGADASIVQTVVVRVFGKGTDRSITHRKVQGETPHVLNEHGFGAKVLGVFKNGLVEEFIEADSVAPEDLASGGALLRRVASQMRRLHKEVAPDLTPRSLGAR